MSTTTSTITFKETGRTAIDSGSTVYYAIEAPANTAPFDISRAIEDNFDVEQVIHLSFSNRTFQVIEPRK